jgi:hypothetical protein
MQPARCVSRLLLPTAAWHLLILRALAATHPVAGMLQASSTQCEAYFVNPTNKCKLQQQAATQLCMRVQQVYSTMQMLFNT